MAKKTSSKQTAKMPMSTKQMTKAMKSTGSVMASMMTTTKPKKKK